MFHLPLMTLTSMTLSSQSARGCQASLVRPVGGKPGFPFQSWEGRQRFLTVLSCVLDPGQRDHGVSGIRCHPGTGFPVLPGPWASFGLSLWVSVPPFLPMSLNFRPGGPAPSLLSVLRFSASFRQGNPIGDSTDHGGVQWGRGLLAPPLPPFPIEREKG